MKKWACFSIFEVKVAILAPSIALFWIILFLSDSNIFYIALFFSLSRVDKLKNKLHLQRCK